VSTPQIVFRADEDGREAVCVWCRGSAPVRPAEVASDLRAFVAAHGDCAAQPRAAGAARG
jgi:hypothetical protein